MRESDFEVYACEASAEFPRYSGPTLVKLLDGRIALAYAAYRGETHDWSQSHLEIKYSADSGRHWSAPEVFQPNVGGHNVNGPSLLRLKSGDILFVFRIANAFDDVRIVARRSGDEMRSWTELTEVTVGRAYHTIVNHRAVQSSNGRILLPVFSASDLDDYHFVTQVHYSDDQGRTWRQSATLIDCPKGGAMEPCLVEVEDRHLLMLIRTQLGFLYESRSVDDGETWTAPTPTALTSPDSSLLAVRVPNGNRLAVIWNHVCDMRPMPNPRGDKAELMEYYRRMSRSPLTVAVSDDGGHTWFGSRDLETDPIYSFAYPTILFDGNRALLCYWVSDPQTKQTSLKIRGLGLEWFDVRQEAPPV